MTIPGVLQSYSGFPGVPDFGVYYGVPLYDSTGDAETMLYFYRFADFPADVATVDYDYYELLKSVGFSYTGTTTEVGGFTSDVYINNSYMVITTMETVLNGVPVYMVGVTR